MTKAELLTRHLYRGRPIHRGNAARLFDIPNVRSEIARVRKDGFNVITRSVRQNGGGRLTVYELVRT